MRIRKYSSSMLGICFGLLVISCSSSFKLKWTQKEAPDYFTAKFETTQGDFEIEARKEWSPEGVNRLYQLIKHNYYTDIAIFRVIPDYVAQFGIHNDSVQTNAWNEIPLADEPVLKSNTKGAISFARGGPETRGTQLFINLKDNSPRLDTLTYLNVTGFPVVAQVISGMEVVENFYKGYGRELEDKQGLIYENGNRYLKENYPKLDYIRKAYITGKK